MATTFGQPEAIDIELLYTVMVDSHKHLWDARVSVGILMADNEESRPIKKNGVPCLAKIAIVPLWLRALIGGCGLSGSLSMQRPPVELEASTLDLILMIDRREWMEATNEQKQALLDHELSHVVLTKEEGNNLKRDDLGRPKLKLRNGDWDGSDGFIDVVKRWGDDAPEYRSAERVMRIARASVEEHKQEARG